MVRNCLLRRILDNSPTSVRIGVLKLTPAFISTKMERGDELGCGKVYLDFQSLWRIARFNSSAVFFYDSFCDGKTET